MLQPSPWTAPRAPHQAPGRSLTAFTYTGNRGQLHRGSDRGDLVRTKRSGRSITFTVTVTFASLQNPVRMFSTDPDVTAGLNEKLATAGASANKIPRDNQLNAFVNRVDAQAAKALTAAQARR